MRAITPSGLWESRRLPGSGAGPSPDRMLLGSEGILGVITEAWVRVQERPRFKLSCGVAFDSFAAGAEAVRELAQSGLNPSNCRLLDEAESALTHAGPAGQGPARARLRVGAPSRRRADGRSRSRRPATTAASRARSRAARGPEAAARAWALRANPPPEADGDDPVGAWRHAFLAAPYLRDTFVACGVLSRHLRDRDHLGSLRRVPRRGDGDRPPRDRRACGAPPDGPGSPRLSLPLHPRLPGRPGALLHGPRPAQRGGEVEQWDEIKAAVSEAVIDAGGTITHHHAVGRDHRPWYDRQRPDPFAEALRARQARSRPGGRPQPRGPDRPVTFRACEMLTEASARKPSPAWRRVTEERRRSRAGARRGARRRVALLVAMRPPEWIKNLLVFAGLLFSQKLDEGRAVVDALLTFVAFCAISSAGYLFNDLRDVEHDRRHPEKRHRPIASGELSRRATAARAPPLLAVARDRDRAGRRSRPRSPASSRSTASITVAYSLVLKRLVIIDVMTIASLFILRVVAGAVAVEAHASEYLLVCTGMLALFLGFTKRRQEAILEEPPTPDRRPRSPDDPAGARALLAPVPRPDGRDGHRRGDHQLRDLRDQLAAHRLEDARHRAVGALRDLPLPVPDLRPRRHPLDRGDPHRGPGDDLRRRHLGRPRRSLMLYAFD